MVARAAVRGLSTEDLSRIREQLSAGRRPKVQFTEAAGQIAGQVGQVVELTDPAASDEWVVVRFGRDELPFSPADLIVAPRGAGRAGSRARNGAAPDAQPEVSGPELRLTEPPKPESPRPEPGGPESSASVPQPRAESSPAPPAQEGKPAARKGARAAKPKAPPALTVTLAYAEGEWTVAAQQGNKVLAKPYVVRPAEAMRMVSLVDVPGVHEAVEQILAAERAEAEQQAERLRAELAEIEARLAELRDAG
ncbi:hypothetical protein [Rhizomonospora bruguierae]|uniref:hypothetical protein n=1 Tax=Rhizomonospora bruguierae TaxID=1581705 RepID=UPI001BD11817|nr:hypothetical protein [Micromonospora sp. NBRC 107566]